MKILRNKNVFKKMNDKTWKDAQVINEMIRVGWTYCSHKDYREYHNAPKVSTEATTIAEGDKTVKGNKPSKSTKAKH